MAQQPGLGQNLVAADAESRRGAFACGQAGELRQRGVEPFVRFY